MVIIAIEARRAGVICPRAHMTGTAIVNEYRRGRAAHGRLRREYLAIAIVILTIVALPRPSIWLVTLPAAS